MRYDTPVYFQKSGKSTYNKQTGNHETSPAEETRVYASVSSAEADAVQLIYGALKQDVVMVHLQNQYKDAFDFVRIGSKIYRPDYVKRLRTKEIMYLSEVQPCPE
jgi:hypothetical protein